MHLAISHACTRLYHTHSHIGGGCLRLARPFVALLVGWLVGRRTSPTYQPLGESDDFLEIGPELREARIRRVRCLKLRDLRDRRCSPIDVVRATEAVHISGAVRDGDSKQEACLKMIVGVLGA